MCVFVAESAHQRRSFQSRLGSLGETSKTHMSVGEIDVGATDVVRIPDLLGEPKGFQDVVQRAFLISE